MELNKVVNTQAFNQSLSHNLRAEICFTGSGEHTRSAARPRPPEVGDVRSPIGDRLSSIAFSASIAGQVL